MVAKYHSDAFVLLQSLGHTLFKRIEFMNSLYFLPEKDNVSHSNNLSFK